MKHQSKQALAWVFAIGASTAVYGGGAMWFKRMAKNTHHGSQQDSHEESPHHDETTETKHDKPEAHESAEHENDHGAKTGHDAKAEHGDAHAKNAEHGEDHGKKDNHSEKADHGKKDDHSDAKHGDAHNAVADSHKSDKHGDAKPAVHWSYQKDSATGPNHWGSMGDAFVQCEKGREQSPIDLKKAVTKASAPRITWAYNPVAVSVENNGHTIVAGMPHAQNHILIDGETYTLAQFHFHNPSEHRVNGVPSDMELHFVHKNAKGALAVIGVMLNEKAGYENPFLKPLWQVLPRDAEAKTEAKPTINLAKLLPTHRDYYHYAGSLTTPPCSQGVRWFVMKEPIEMSGSQVDLYSGIFGQPTNRPVQPLFGREIIQSIGPAAVAH